MATPVAPELPEAAFGTARDSAVATAAAIHTTLPGRCDDEPIEPPFSAAGRLGSRCPNLADEWWEGM